MEIYTQNGTAINLNSEVENIADTYSKNDFEKFSNLCRYLVTCPEHISDILSVQNEKENMLELEIPESDDVIITRHGVINCDVKPTGLPVG